MRPSLSTTSSRCLDPLSPRIQQLVVVAAAVAWAVVEGWVAAAVWLVAAATDPAAVLAGAVQPEFFLKTFRTG